MAPMNLKCDVISNVTTAVSAPPYNNVGDSKIWLCVVRAVTIKTSIARKPVLESLQIM